MASNQERPMMARVQYVRRYVCIETCNAVVNYNFQCLSVVGGYSNKYTGKLANRGMSYIQIMGTYGGW